MMSEHGPPKKLNLLDLPPEILGKILVHYVHDRSKTLQVDGEQPSSELRCIAAYFDSRTHPVDLTHVCRLWRTTAISIPQLWAKIHVCRPEFEGDVKIFELWLERSAGPNGTYPLDLTITQSMWPDPEISSRYLGQIISLAIAQHRRWKYISFELNASHDII